MERKAYILTFDRDSDTDYKELHKDITSLEIVHTWSHYIKSSYILIANTDSAKELNDQLLPIMGGIRYIVIEVNLQNRNGRLPLAGWEWMRKVVRKYFE